MWQRKQCPSPVWILDYHVKCFSYSYMIAKNKHPPFLRHYIFCLSVIKIYSVSRLIRVIVTRFSVPEAVIFTHKQLYHLCHKRNRFCKGTGQGWRQRDEIIAKRFTQTVKLMMNHCSCSNFPPSATPKLSVSPSTMFRNWICSRWVIKTVL